MVFWLRGITLGTIIFLQFMPRILVAQLVNNFTVSENASPGTFVGYVRGSPWKNSAGVVVVNSVGLDVNDDYFKFNQDTGEITTRLPLDYENQHEHIYIVVEGSDTIRVQIFIRDENDNPPVFQQSHLTREISEYAKVGSALGSLGFATDRDSGVNGIKDYNITSGNTEHSFRLSTRKIGENVYLDLLVNKPLDRENIASFDLKITAYDGGIPSLSAVLNVKVIILDANDNAPVFAEKTIYVNIPQNASLGHNVVTVLAIDPDEGQDGDVTYRFSDSKNNAQKLFQIGEKTGLIRVADPNLASHNVDEFELIVVARDRGTQYMESSCFVEIKMLKSGVERPRLSFLWLLDGRPAVIEDTSSGEVVARVSVLDPKLDELYPEPCSLHMHDPTGLLEVHQRSQNVFVLKLVRLPDHEVTPNFTLSFRAFDDSNHQRTTAKNVTFFVDDRNDHAPIFKRDHYEADVKERAVPGTSVLQLHATDADSGKNAKLSYSIATSTHQYSDWFEIDEQTGLLSVRQRVDCELNSNPRITVIARDGGEPSKQGQTEISINILDVNDENPKFKQNLYNTSLPESTAVSTCFITATATDSDCGKYSHISYRIAPWPSTIVLPFKVDDKTGTICLNSSLDFETRKSYEFELEALDGGGLIGRTNVLIDIEDVNDHNPEFYPKIYNVSLKQNTRPGNPIITVKALDDDSYDFGKIRYSIVSGNDHGLFRLDPVEGIIYLEQKLAFGGAPTYFLKIDATDGGNSAAQQPALITISVLPDNYESPVFDQRIFKFTASEDMLPGMSVGTVHAKGPSPITYSIYDGDPDGLFNIDPSTGQLSVSRLLQNRKQFSYLVNVQAAMGDPPSYNHTQVNIQIDDINDHSPVFDYPEVTVSITEDQSIDHTIYKARASDQDLGDNGKITYNLKLNPGDLFKIHPSTGQLSLNDRLDYESAQNYTLLVEAKDWGMPFLKSQLTLHIKVLDANDNAPEFRSKHKRVSIPEDAALLTAVTKMTATDRDGGVNGQVTYRLSDSDPRTDRFGIYADSGIIYVRQPLDREMQDSYALTIIAEDQGSPRQSESADVQISILDVNDNRPNCSLSKKQFFVEEHRTPDSMPIGTVLASDSDAGYNGTMYFSFEDSDQQESFPFQIEEKQGYLYATKPLDYEGQKSYSANVVVRDGGRPPLSTICPITVLVDDVNDNPPVFILPHQNRIAFREEQPAGSEIVQLRAQDPDRGENGTLVYSLQAGQADLPFEIDPVFGMLSATKIFDYEMHQRIYEVTVEAKDQGSYPLSSTKTLTIELVDIDDKPLNDSGSYNTVDFLSISELTKVGSKIGAVDGPRVDQLKKAKEQLPEAEFNRIRGEVKYEIIGGNILGLFDIVEHTSELFLVRALNFEQVAIHILKVTKRDMSNHKSHPVHTSLVAKIRVKDENDNAPRFKRDPVIFSVPENARAGTIIWTYNATDPDSGSFGRVRYNIDHQQPEAVFSLDALTGQLMVVRPLDHERYKEYMVVVSAQDQAPDMDERKTTAVTSFVYIIDVNDNAPQFSSLTKINIFEDEPIGYPLTHVIAGDLDDMDNGRVSYSIIDGNSEGKFIINQTSGAITLAKRLDRERQNEYILDIQASDHGKPPKSSTHQLEIVVQDVNDNSPRFQRRIYKATVQENSPIGIEVTRVEALDRDGNQNQQLAYILPKGVTDKFMLDENTGVIKTTAILDRELQETFVLTVYVRDSSYPAKYDVATVIVDVGDQNDSPPQFSPTVCSPHGHPPKTLRVPENTAVTNLYQLLASDSDIGENQHMIFSLVGGNIGDKFSVNSETGVISCRELNYEDLSVYNLTLGVRNIDSPLLADQCSLRVMVMDENDEHPVLDESTYYISDVPESSPVRTILIKVKAVDRDNGTAGQVSFGLRFDQDGGDKFAPFGIDERGQIFVAGRLDANLKDRYEFQVTASDKGEFESLETSSKVVISIKDSNNHVPMFDQYPYIINMSLPLATGGRVAKLQATDNDRPGQNSEIFYSLLPGPESNQFQIKPETGVISARDYLNLPENSVLFLRVKATDKGTPSLSSMGLVEVRIIGPNGQWSPRGVRFDKSSYIASVDEDAHDGDRVTQIKAVDPSGVAGQGVAYRIASVSGAIGQDADQLPFTIDKWTGLITVSRKRTNRALGIIFESDQIDYEKTPKMVLIVGAIDLTTSSEVFATVEVVLNNANDNDPVFLQSQYYAAVKEGLPSGSYVTRIKALDEDGIDPWLESTEDMGITYSIINGNIDDAFTVDVDGVVRTNSELDREIREQYNLEVMATDNGQPIRAGSAMVAVRLLDTNDNTPAFPQAAIYTLTEYSPIGTLIATLYANDVDLGPMLRYNFLPGGNADNRFFLDQFSGDLYLANYTDYEKFEQYELEIQVSDGVKSAVTRPIIKINDENDNDPIFTKPFYQVAVPENTLGGSSITRVTAHDEDSGKNGKIQYSIGSMSPMVTGFWIEPDTGEVFTNISASFDGRGLDVVQMTLEATDSGSPPRQSLSLLQIHIVPRNEIDQPTFAKNQFKFTIPENLPIHSNIGNLNTIRKKNNGDKARHLLYGIKSGNIDETFEVDSTGNVQLKRPLDRELRDVYEMQVSVHTPENSVANSTAKIIIIVTDINDNVPVFENPIENIKIRESHKMYTPIATVKATDIDLNENGRITYNITSGNGAKFFAIKPATGELNLLKELDFESDTIKFRLIVTATDHGTSPNTAVATVNIEVTDENDHEPQFLLERYPVRIKEGSHSEVLVTVKATDQDQGEYGNIHYDIAPDAELYYKQFTINRESGEIKAIQELDYEDGISRRLSVMATDKGGKFGKVEVDIILEPVDEFPSKFEQPTYRFKVSYNAEIGDLVGTVTATDEDKGPSGPDGIRYSLLNPNQYFAIDEVSGTLRVTATLESLSHKYPVSENRVAQYRVTKQASNINDERTYNRPHKPLVQTMQYTVQAKTIQSSQRPATTEVTLELGFFDTGSKSAAGSLVNPTTIAVVSVVLIIIIVIIIVIILLRLKRQQKSPDYQAPVSTHYSTAAYAVPPASSQMKPPPFTPRAPTVEATTYDPVAQTPTENRGLKTSGPGFHPRSQLYSLSNISQRSSGHDSMVGGDEGDAFYEDGVTGVQDLSTGTGRTLSRDARSAPDSGFLHDDTLSMASDVANAQEYLTSLGVDSGQRQASNVGHSISTSHLAQTHNTGQAQGSLQRRGAPPNANCDVQQIMKHSAIDSFMEEHGDNTPDGIDVQNLIYAKLSEVSADEIDISAGNRLPPYAPSRLAKPFAKGAHQRTLATIPSASASPASSPAFSHHYQSSAEPTPQRTAEWGPSYQPLSHVFSEIAKFKDSQDTLRRKKEAAGQRGSPSEPPPYNISGHELSSRKPLAPTRLNQPLMNRNPAFPASPTTNLVPNFGQSPVTPISPTFPPNGSHIPRTSHLHPNLTGGRKPSKGSDMSDTDMEIKI